MVRFLIETGPYSVFPRLVKEMGKVGYEVDDIKHVFLTHIHLDHAGAAWAFAQKGTTVYVHPFGYRHLADPSKLMESARRIYRDQMDTLWGSMEAIPETHLKAVEHGNVIPLGNTEITAWHTPGHAVHHIAWQFGGNLFTGDVAGVCIEGGPPVPPCPPPDINVEDWQKSLALIKNMDIDRLFLTHFGEVTDMERHLNALEQTLLQWANWMLPYFKKGASVEEITPLFMEMAQNELKTAGVNEEMLQRYEAANPTWMSVAGLLRYWRKKNQNRLNAPALMYVRNFYGVGLPAFVERHGTGIYNKISLFDVTFFQQNLLCIMYAFVRTYKFFVQQCANPPY